MRFADIIGHEDVKSRLRQMANEDRIPHALMLAGNAGIGKMRMARAFAQYVACQHRHDGDACGVCPTCRQINALGFPDVSYTYPIVNLGSKSVTLCSDYSDQWSHFLADHSYMPFKGWCAAIESGNKQPVIYVHESGVILQRMSLSTYSAKYKINIIWLPEKMNLETANKLLKIIEEPYSDSIFLLVSNEPDKLLDTIRSRTQTIMMRPLDARVIADALVRDTGCTPQDATAAARLAQGSYGAALETITQGEEATEFRTLFQEIMRMTYARNAPQMKALSERIAAMGRDRSRRYLEYMQSMLRENLIYNLHNPELNLLSDEEEAFSRKFSPFVNGANIQAMSESVSQAASDIGRNANAKIVCFDMLLQIMMNIRKK